MSYTGRVSDAAMRTGTEQERASDVAAASVSYADRAKQVISEKKQSVLDRLHDKQEQVAKPSGRQMPERKLEPAL